MVGEPDADVMVAEVVPRGGLLVGRLLAPASVLVVQYVVELQAEAGFVLQYSPADGGVPDEDVAVHAAEGVAPAGVLGEGGVEDEVAVAGLSPQAVVIVPVGGVQPGRGGVAQALGADLGEDGGLEPVVVEG